MRGSVVRSETDRKMSEQLEAVTSDPERALVLTKARSFKRSWIELAESLTQVSRNDAWKGWGYDTFESYCRQELHLKAPTVTKLVSSYGFLRSKAPRVIERAREPDDQKPIPTLQAVDFVARAVKGGSAPAETLREIRKAAFDEGADAANLNRRFADAAFPVTKREKTNRLRAQLLSTARRLRLLMAEPAAAIPPQVAAKLEDAVSKLVQTLER